MRELLFFIAVILLIAGAICAVKYNKSKYKMESGTKLSEVIFDKGKFGEFLIFKELEKIKGVYKTLANLYIPTVSGKTTEIDLVFIHENGVYVIESKNYSGWIFGNENNKNWTQVLKGGKKEKFYNPIWQNNTHIRNLLRVLDIEERYVESLIVFSERCKLKDITVNSENIIIINRGDLGKTIKTLIKKSNVKLEENKMSEMYDKLRSYSNVSKDIKLIHIDNIKNKKINQVV